MIVHVLDGNTAVNGVNALISIHHVNAERIFAGNKRYELRKVAPKIVPRMLFLYETGTQRCISGHIVIDKVVCGDPDRIWRIVGESAATRERFWEYFHGFDYGCAFEICKAVRYKKPFPLKVIQRIDAGFRVPQNFLYLGNLPALERVLIEAALEECLLSLSGELALTRIRDENRARFVEEIDKHISGSYNETGRDYGGKLLDIDKNGRDCEGVITLRKVVLEIHKGNELAGFLVLTEKGGGSVKTGPTVLLEGYRRKGLGGQLRELVHEAVLGIGGRKVYCTAPEVSGEAVGYLLGAGYRIEGHLARQYHLGHNEFVFGYLLNRTRGPAPEFSRTQESIRSICRMERADAEVIAFIEEEFRENYCVMPRGWAGRQAAEAAAYAKGHGSSFKPRIVFVGKGDSVLSVVICVIKRGGAAKLLVLSRRVQPVVRARYAASGVLKSGSLAAYPA
jgi:predicted transcriptional regulator